MGRRRRFALVFVGLGLVSVALAAGVAVAASEGQLVWAVHVSLAPTWFDPAETPGDGSGESVEDLKLKKP